MKSKFLLAVAASVITATVLPLSIAIAQATPGTYHVVRKLPVGGDGGWDYVTVDTVGNRLFLWRGPHARVIDPGDGSVSGDSRNTLGVPGVAGAPPP